MRNSVSRWISSTVTVEFGIFGSQHGILLLAMTANAIPFQLHDYEKDKYHNGHPRMFLAQSYLARPKTLLPQRNKTGDFPTKCFSKIYKGFSKTGFSQIWIECQT
jgi:hypothetical protein